MVRIVLDTNVLVAALSSSRGASYEVLRRVALGRVRPLVTIALFLEYEAILKREVQLNRHGLAISEIDQLMSELARLSDPVEVHFLWRPQLSDIDDEMVLEAAVNGRCDFLVTHNRRDFQRAAARFELRVVTPAQLLMELDR